MSVTLTRWCHSEVMGTFGTLRVGAKEWFSVECPWRDNAPSVSCIPEGNYPLKLGKYFGGDGIGGRPDYPAYEILHVPDRAQIKIHRANISLQVKGCVAIGRVLGVDLGRWAVRESQLAYDEFMAAMDGALVSEINVRWAVLP